MLSEADNDSMTADLSLVAGKMKKLAAGVIKFTPMPKLITRFITRN